MRALLLSAIFICAGFTAQAWAADTPAVPPSPAHENTYEEQPVFPKSSDAPAGFWDSLHRGDLARPPAEEISTMESKKMGTQAPKPLQTPELAPALYKLFLYLAAILALIFFFVYLLKRLLPKSSPFFSGGMIRVVARHFLDQKKVIYIINIGDRQFLIVGTTPEHINTLAEVTDPELIKDILAQASINAPATPKGGGNFVNILREKLFGSKSGASSSAEKRG